VLLAFGLIGLAICLRFRRELIQHKQIIPFCSLGAVCLVLMVGGHLLEKIHIVFEVVEESFKLMGVSFFFAGYLGALLSFIKNISITAGITTEQ
jgi:hypothetical protein